MCEDRATRDREIAEKVLASSSNTNRKLQQVISKKDREITRLTRNLERAVGKREASQDRLILAVRQLKGKDRELAERRELLENSLEMLESWISGPANDPRWAETLVPLTNELLNEIREAVYA